MSVLQVNSIKDSSDTKTLATLSNSTVTLHDDVLLPAGSVKNVWSDQVHTNVTVANTGGQATNTDSITNVHTNFRVYTKIASVTVNVASGNHLMLSGWFGCQSSDGAMSNKGCWGGIFVVPDASGNNRGYEGSIFPFYAAYNITSSYGEDWSGSLLVGAYSGDTIATGNISVGFYAFNYNETSPNQTQNLKVGKRYFTVMEIQR